jgi:hypothetical protein
MTEIIVQVLLDYLSGTANTIADPGLGKKK